LALSHLCCCASKGGREKKKKNIGAKGRLGQKELLQYSSTDCINNYGASMGICNVRVSHQFFLKIIN
jgi:hypothetical protein